MATRTFLLSIVALLGLLACSDKAPKPGDDTSVVVQPGTVHDTPASTDPRAAIFVQKGCPQCHSISAFGIKSPAELGPDLTMAAEDVKTRFNMPLEEFLHNPTGTMQIVLSSQIQLSTEERDSIIRILKELHEASETEGDE